MDYQDQALPTKEWREMRELINQGCDYFWNNPEKPWRKHQQPSNHFGQSDWLFGRAIGGGKIPGYEPEEHREHPPSGHGGI
jgi:hypothetical protein|tara:strand:- start:4512 stop:4754 length:243 start_codon:yes stop_codon:yes gene_type:complete